MKDPLFRRSTLLFTLCIAFYAEVCAQRASTANTLTILLTTDSAKPVQKVMAPKEVVQAPYYDAIELVYVLHNYKAYPLVSSVTTVDDGTGGGAPTKPNSGPSADDNAPTDNVKASVNSYILVEAETGKILFGPSTNVDTMTAVLRRDTFANSADQKALLIKIFRRNTWGGPEMNDDQIWTSAQGNPFFFTPQRVMQPFAAGGPIPAVSLPAFSLLSTGSQASTLGLIGGADPFSATSIAEGVAKLLISRVNKEFQNNFIDLLVNYLQQKHPEVGILFPQTLKALKQFQLTQYKSSYTAIQNACKTDISALLGNVSALTTLDWCKKMIVKYPPLVLLFTSCDVVDMLRQNMVLPEILYRAGNASYVNDPANITSYTSFVRLMALVSNSVRDIQIRTGNKVKQGWIDTDKLAYLLTNPAIYQTFLGTMVQNSIGIQFTINGVMYDFHDLLVRSYPRLIQEQAPVYNLMQEIINGQAIAASFTTTLQLKPPQLINYVNAFSGVANYLLDLTQAGVDVLEIDSTEALRMHIKAIKAVCTPIIGDLDSIAYDITQQQYASAVGEGLQLLNSILAQASPGSGALQQDLAATTKVIQQEVQKNKQAAIAAGPAIPTDSVKNFIKFINAYGQFFGAVAEAQNSQDIANALDAFALPPGSSRAQKENNVTVGLNAYVNVYHSWNKQYTGNTIPKNETGISAPIGFAFSMGLCHGKGGAFTAFAGLLDVGAIFSYEATDTNSIKSTISWGQLFAPSISLIYDAPLFNHKKFNLPLEVGAGFQWGPRLKKVAETGNSTLPFLTERFNLFIGFDIPILHLYSYKKS